MRKAFYLTLSFLLSINIAYVKTVDNPNYKGGKKRLFYKQYDAESGLLGETVYGMYSDEEDGFLYFATDRGLFRYNGIHFKLIPVIGKRSSDVSNIRKDNSGKIWCHNFSNQIFYIENDTLRPYELTRRIDNSGLIIDFRIVDNKLYLNNTIQIYEVDLVNNSIVDSFGLNKGESIIESFTIFNNTLTYFSTNNRKVHFVSLKNKQIESVPLNFKSTRLENYQNTLYAIQSKNNSKGEIVSVSPNGINIISNQSIHENIFINFLRIIDDVYWICTNQGLYKYTQAEGFELILEKYSISDIVKDYQGNLWVSTLGKGVFCIPQTKILNHSFEEKMAYSAVVSIDDNLFVGTSNGDIFQFDSKSGNCIAAYKTGENDKATFFKKNPKNGYIYSNYLVIDSQKKRVVEQSYFGRDIDFDDEGNVFLAQYISFALIPYSQNSFKPIGNAIKFSKIEDLKYNRYNYLIENKRPRVVFRNNTQKEFWVSYVNELVVYDSLWNKKIIQDKSGLQIFANCIITDAQNRVWIGTTNQGILVFENRKLHKHIQFEDEMAFVKELKSFNGTVYALTSVGIFQVHPETFETRQINSLRESGIPLISSFDIVDSTIWTCSSNGLLSFPLRFKVNDKSGKFIISSTKVSDINLVKSQVSEFKFNQNNLTCSFEPVYFLSDNYEFRYHLTRDNEEVKWKTVPQNSGFLSFSSLEHGSYELGIQMLSLDYDTSTTYTYLFTIKKPFWLLWWFITLEFIFGILILYSTAKLVRYQVGKRQLFKERLILSQLTALRAQMNPHFLYNVLNSLQGLIYSNKLNEASEYLSRFSDHLRNTLGQSDKQEITIKEEVNNIQTYLELEKMRFGEEYTFKVINKGVSDSVRENTKIPSMIIQPFVENAVKHGLLNKKGQKELSVEFKCNSNLLVVEIIDNGIGRKASAQINKLRKDKPGSFATHAINTRIDLMNKHRNRAINLDIHDMEDKHGLALGTQVVINIPLSNG
jgi:sensor histidine kinase YesM